MDKKTKGFDSRNFNPMPVNNQFILFKYNDLIINLDTFIDAEVYENQNLKTFVVNIQTSHDCYTIKFETIEEARSILNNLFNFLWTSSSQLMETS